MGKPTKAELADRAESREMLLKWLKPGDTIYTTVKHVSRSGMQREISLFYVDESRNLNCIDGIAARAMGMRWNDRRGGIKIGGCGMDMGYQLVYLLGCYLWPKGTDKPHGIRNGEPDSDGGYALKHRWI